MSSAPQQVSSTGTNGINPEVRDKVYHDIMARVPPDALPITKCILAFHVLQSTEVWQEEISNALDVQNFLCLNDPDFYGALRELHSVISVPPSEDAAKQNLRFFDKSFGEFLQDPSRSKEYALKFEEARFNVAELAIRHYNDITHSNNCKLNGGR
jgi:hypothetical protein